MATADLSPAPIRPAPQQLAAQLRAGSHPATPCCSSPSRSPIRVPTCRLLALLAFTSRAQRLGDLLQALAESTREEVSLRLRIETSRASVAERGPHRGRLLRGVRRGLAVLARSYSRPFGSAEGQVVLLA